MKIKQKNLKKTIMEYFNLKSSKVVKNLLALKPKFVFPTRTQFGELDEVCNSIVRELEKRNFKVPGIDVEFYSSHQGITVNTVKGQDFKLWFCGINIMKINIPKKELTIYDDESGPGFYFYVGKDWKKYKKSFMYGSKVHSKLEKSPRRYLKYSGAFGKPGEELALCYPSSWSNTRRPFLIHDNDSGREYDPKGNEPRFFVTEDVMKEFTEWLKENVLNHITKQQFPENKLEIFSC
jgi:hypothetical protein